MNDVEHTQNIENTEMGENIDPDLKVYPVRTQLFGALSLLLFVFAGSYMPELLNKLTPPATNASDTVYLTIKREEFETKKAKADAFEELSITAKSAYVWDIRSQRALYNKNADEQLPLASITKLMTALVAYELLDTESDIDITIDAIRQEGESGFSDGETFSLRDLTDLTLVTSSNDGAYALAAAAGEALTDGSNTAQTFVEAMNIRAEEIGLSQTYFKNPTGLDVSETIAGAYGSARDIAFLMEYIVTQYPEVLELTTEDLTEIANNGGERHLAQNTNHTVIDIPGIIGSKTGYTTLAGGNLIVAFDAGLNSPIVISVLGSTRSGRFRDTLSLVEATREYISPDSN